MNTENSYIRSDLADECCVGEAIGSEIEMTEKSGKSFRSVAINVPNDDLGKRIGKSAGNYITVSFQTLPHDELTVFAENRGLSDRDGNLSPFDEIAEEIASTTAALIDKTGIMPHSVLVVGLGNRAVTADAIGPLAVDGIAVTRHLHDILPPDAAGFPVSAFTPGVVGQTGIETLELVIGAVRYVKPSHIIAIDSLVARSSDRLALTVQLTDTGIVPGSGIGNTRSGITEASLGVPVIAIGVPMIVESSTLVSDALEKAGIDQISPALRKVLENGKSYFVTVRDGDLAVSVLSSLISSALNRFFAHLSYNSNNINNMEREE